MTEKVIALDIGNVCIGIHPERCFGALGFRSLADIPREVLFLAGERFERGEISEAEFLDGFRRLIIKKENNMATPYKECPHCGAHLDSGEKCDCRAAGNPVALENVVDLDRQTRENNKAMNRVLDFIAPEK